MTLRAVHKERPHFLMQKTSDFSKFGCVRTDKGGGGLSQCGHFADKGVNFSHFLMQKTSDFSKFGCVRTDKGGGGLSQCEYFADKGVNFSRVCVDVLYGRPLFRFLKVKVRSCTN